MNSIIETFNKFETIDKIGFVLAIIAIMFVLSKSGVIPLALAMGI